MDKKRRVEGNGGRVLGNERFPVRGLLTCPRCGKNLTGSGAKENLKLIITIIAITSADSDLILRS